MADDILKEAIEAFGEAEAAESDNRTAALDDLRFARLGGEWQWPDKIRKQRELEGRPCLTINKMPGFIRQVVNDARQNKPGIAVHPVEKGDEKTAEVMSGLIRSIEAQSNADIAYDTAVDFSATTGVGYIRVNLDYACDDTFDKDIIIKPVPNPFAVYGDPYSQAADSSDWMSSFVIEQMSEAAFKRKYPGAKMNDFGFGSWADGWADTSARKARVAEYWKRSETTRNLVQYTHEGAGEVAVAFEDEIERLQEQYGMIEIIGQPRPVKSFKVKQYVLTANEVISTVEWPGKYIPIIPVYGEEVNVEGKRYFRSLIRDAKDPQKMFNFWRTSATEMVALASRAPFIGPKGFAKSDPRWITANNAAHAFLEYDGPTPPAREAPPSVPVGDLQMALNSADDMKAVMGIYDASLGARSNETSGRAIMARQREGDVATFHFIDNLSRAIRHTGKILIDIIPKVYNVDRIIRTLGIDGKAEQVQLTSEAERHNPAEGIYNLTAGKYDLTVKAGPGYTTQREEARDMLTELVRANREMAPIIGDIIIELMDIPGGDKVVKRLKAMLPDQIRAAEEGENPEAQALQQQMQQLMQQGQQAIAELQDELAKAEADKSEDERKNNVEAYKAVTERLTAIGAMMTPEMIQQMVIATMQDVAETAALVPGGDMPQQMAPMMPPMEEPQFQPEMGNEIDEGQPFAMGPMEPDPMTDMGQPEGQF